ncbi:hypothetical protein [Virgibacillus litoralis]|uniref:Uncharacterized protein n=1 Tax=Virgibacillus litoralis TaxID=578221 RepID=A0ABS4HFM6_9BACI|nr:hypothetical protein [Virgibacillus litoralis]MBP1949715.1 hypothetical protein [Virgibacillus litoralis]
MHWIGMLNILMILVESFNAINANKKSALRYMHAMFALMFLTFSAAAFMSNMWIGVFAVLFGFIGIFMKSEKKEA